MPPLPLESLGRTPPFNSERAPLRWSRKGGQLRVHVDYDLCTSNAVCMGIAPEIFEVRDDGFMYVLNENPGPEFDERLHTPSTAVPTARFHLRSKS